MRNRRLQERREGKYLLHEESERARERERERERGGGEGAEERR